MQKYITCIKLLSVNSTFAANYQYLSYKYGLIDDDWFTPLDHLLGNVKKKIVLLHPQPILCDILKELCAIRDNTSRLEEFYSYTEKIQQKRTRKTKQNKGKLCTANNYIQ